MSETKFSTNVFFHRFKEPLVVVGTHDYDSKKNPDGTNAFESQNVSISVDNPEAHLDLSLPRDAARELVEKMQLQLKDMWEPYEE